MSWQMRAPYVRHGVRSTYQRGCRCLLCREANTDYLRRRTPTIGPDDLGCLCWCEAEIVAVPAAEIRRCLTRSCGRPGCEEQA